MILFWRNYRDGPKQGGRRFRGLANRREAEAGL